MANVGINDKVLPIAPDNTRESEERRTWVEPKDEEGAILLTARERDVFNLLGVGKTSKEIASILHIGTGTVANHRKSICRKLSVHSAAELICSAAITLMKYSQNYPIEDIASGIREQVK